MQSVARLDLSRVGVAYSSIPIESLFSRASLFFKHELRAFSMESMSLLTVVKILKYTYGLGGGVLCTRSGGAPGELRVFSGKLRF
jgi:hypothetical protein